MTKQQNYAIIIKYCGKKPTMEEVKYLHDMIMHLTDGQVTIDVLNATDINSALLRYRQDVMNDEDVVRNSLNYFTTVCKINLKEETPNNVIAKIVSKNYQKNELDNMYRQINIIESNSTDVDTSIIEAIKTAISVCKNL